MSNELVIPFNVNSYVLVKLTAHGFKLYAQRFVDLKCEYRHLKMEGDYAVFPLWELMSFFGEHMYNGCTMPFEADIKIPLQLAP